MFYKHKNKNSWVFSVENKTNTKHYHHYFCICNNEFKLQTEINEPEAPDILCPICGNDYFKDAVAFHNMTSTKIWKCFYWTTVTSENEEYWSILLKYDVPLYNEASQEVKLGHRDLLVVRLKKDGSLSFDISYSSKIISRYSLFLDDKVQQLQKLLVDEAKESLYSFIMMNKSKVIEWIDSKRIESFSVDNRLKYLTFFLKNPHLKEPNFFFWKIGNLHRYTLKHSTQLEMLDFIINNRKEKSVKKALYQSYEDAIKNIEYYPYCDYIFSRTIENSNLLVKLLKVDPAMKQYIFTDNTFPVGIDFILFLKRHYTENQIAKFFFENIQDAKEQKNSLYYWRDTLQMVQSHNGFNSLEEHFLKVKLTIKKLHDEIVRVFHIVSYELDARESFEYNDKYLAACGDYKEFEFRLPSTVKELSLWAKILHNCMFGYSRRIHQKHSIIYGVFKANELLYAVELNGSRIVQAKSVSNGIVPNADMSTINDWRYDRFK